MATPRNLTNAEKEMIRPNLIASLDPDSVEYADILLEEQVCDSYPDGIHLITIPVEGYPAMQFNADTGEFAELTYWDYILALDTDAQQAETQAMKEVEETSIALQHYHRNMYNNLTDYEKVINNCTEVDADGITLYKYECPGQTIYLKDDNYPETYDNQYVDEEYEYYYYNFTDTQADTSEVDKYQYKVRYDWKRSNIWED